jgi:hypothetical protein
MPPPLPDRYQLEVRIGRDGDIEQWLATDTSLDRPVEIRVLGPDADEERRAAFLRSVRGAAAVSHPHFTSVFTAGEVRDGVFAVFEWTGAIALADRLRSGETIPVDEFLPNAAGVADALACLHAEGIVHGAIDTSSIFHAVAHPAKLGGIGRQPVTHTAIEDVQALALALEEGLTGRRPGGPAPSEMVDGLNPAVDRALRLAQAGRLSARALSDQLAAAPSPNAPPPESPRFARRLLLAAITLVLAATGLIALGRVLLADTGAPILVPEGPSRNGSVVLPTTSQPAFPASSTTIVHAPVAVASSISFDPYGGEEENDERLPNLTDGDLTTVWRTETYRDPLPRLKPGVGVAFRVDSPASILEIQGFTAGTRYRVGWAASRPADLSGWDIFAAATNVAGDAELQLPANGPGWWLVWLTDLPESPEGGWIAQMAEVRFRR